MGTVAAAFAVGLTVQFVLGVLLSISIAAAGFVAMLAGHLALRCSDGRAADTIAKDTAEMPDADLIAKADRRPGGARTRPTAPAPVISGPKQRRQNATPSWPAPEMAASQPKAAASPAKDDVSLKDLDLGNFRPRSPADLSADPVKDPMSNSDSGGSIDDMIRRLADDIESGRKLPTAQDASALGQVKSTPPEASRRTAPLVKGAEVKTEAQVRVGKEADQPPAPPPLPSMPRVTAPAIGTAPAAAAKSVKAPSKMAPTMTAAATPPALPVDLPKTAPSATAKLAAIADALSDEQMEVFLETINGLDDYRAQHYEVSVRLRLGNGEVLNNDAFISETRGTGLLPLLEAVKVSSTKRLAVQMIRRGRTGEFFSAVDGEALSDRQFGDDVDTITGGDTALASRLVLAFSQADVRSLTPAQLFTLDSIAALGFRFSVEDITDLDMDFEQLVKRGFTFAKLDADVFLSGLPTGTTKVPSADICRHLAKAGLSLIVGKISDETARAKILGFGAVLGQGPLFGAPRPVRADVLRPGEQRAPVA